MGSNMERREENILEAALRLDRLEGVGLTGLSSLYETEPVGVKASRSFINAVCLVETYLDPRALLEACKRLEREFGRCAPWERPDRPLDIDIVIFGDLAIREEDLEVPHPRFRDRLFVIAPLGEICPNLAIPPDGLTASEAAGKWNGGGWVRRVSSRRIID